MWIYVLPSRILRSSIDVKAKKEPILNKPREQNLNCFENGHHAERNRDFSMGINARADAEFSAISNDSSNYAVHVNVTTDGEIGDLQSSINEMSVSLDQAKQNLENKVLERTKDLEAFRNNALKADAEKRKLIRKTNSIVGDERESIALVIHDELNATLTEQ
jgi:hypothetical protein